MAYCVAYHRIAANLACLLVAGVAVAAKPVVKEPSEPGLSLTFQTAGGSDVRIARLVALTVPDKTPPTPFIAPGPFWATFEGDVNLKLRDEYAFSVAGRGAVKLSIN